MITIVVARHTRILKAKYNERKEEKVQQTPHTAAYLIAPVKSTII